jgi:hypothetical protein
LRIRAWQTWVSIRSIFIWVGENSGRMFMAGIPVVRHEVTAGF